jgi:cold-inducible RNA-binding protein
MVSIYVGNLQYNSTEEQIEQLFSEYGKVNSVKLIKDRETGRSRGFGFVEMEDQEGANAAIQALDGKDVGGRNLRVNEAKQRDEGEQRPRKQFDNRQRNRY